MKTNSTSSPLIRSTSCRPWMPTAVLATAAIFTLAGCASVLDMQPLGKVVLTGAAEVPAVTTEATGSGTILVANDRSVSGSITTMRIDATAAHIHMAPKGSNGPVVVPMTKTAEGTWTIPAGARFTDTQYASYVAGNMYVNVHSAAFPCGEIRGQLTSN